ncbi:hypothetical protein CK203_004149 [Vitis vinifera]|uniref:Uncharacterized protein n=1 Tax=Vitis vinifera TaxID=29760 RepID=A0A438K9X1_VITVI|nr:hypothetical protein CK203_004149 [Vitis vinifera]
MSHPLAPSAKGWMTCSPRPFCSHIIHYEPPRDSSYQNFPHTMGPTSLRSYHALSTADDARYWQRRTTVQSISRQPTRAGPLMVSSPTSQLCWQFQGPVRSFRGTILVLRTTQAEHQHSAKHKNARQRILKGVREAIWSSRTSGRGLQHGCCPTDLQAKHLSRHSIFESLAKNLLQRWTTCSDVPTNIQCSKMTCVHHPASFGCGRPSRGERKEMLNLRIGQGRLTEGRKGQVARKGRLTPLSISYEKLLPMIQGLSTSVARPHGTDPSTRDHTKCVFHKDHGHTQRHAGPPVLVESS